MQGLYPIIRRIRRPLIQVEESNVQSPESKVEVPGSAVVSTAASGVSPDAPVKTIEENVRSETERTAREDACAPQITVRKRINLQPAAPTAAAKPSKPELTKDVV
jgi:hypothetical protein